MDGYPAAGIGGGGAGGGAGDTAEGGGGFSSGGGEAGSIGGDNGNPGKATGTWSSGGSYFSRGILGSSATKEGMIGGIGAGKIASTKTYAGGNGGSGGKGGTVIVKGNNEKIKAYNGSYITDIEAVSQSIEWKATNQSIIYAQLGYSLEAIRLDTELEGTINVPKIDKIVSRNASELISELGNNYRTIDYSTYINYNNIGIGSGAGYIELSNGTYTIDGSMN